AALGGSILGASLRMTGASRRYCWPLGALALLVMATEARDQWQRIEQAFRGQRDRSRPSYALGMRARSLPVAPGDPELYFVGAQSPTLVYYSKMRCHFVAQSSASGFRLPDPDGNPVEVGYHQLVMRDNLGAVSIVGSLDDEWNLSGPPEERRPVRLE